MSSTIPDSAAVDSPLTNPSAFVDDARLPSTRVVREQDESHFETRDEYAGFVIVGITNDDGDVLLLETEKGAFWRLPHARVDSVADYVQVAVDNVHTQLGHDVLVDRIVQVRQFDAVLEESQAATVAGDIDDPDDLRDFDGHTRAHDVLFEVSLPTATGADADAIEFHGDPEVSWFDSVPDGAPGGLPGDDLRLFFG